MKPIHHVCPICNRDFTGPKMRIYCSRECYLKAPRQEAWNKGMKGVKANKPKNGTDKICKHCGKTFYTPACYPDAVYCSHECYSLDRWNGSRKETRNCIICKKPFTVTKAQVKVTCSNACNKKHKRNSHLGEKSHLWRGGKTAPYHTEWRVFRAMALERDDYKCVICGSTDRIQVHHKIPYRYSKSHNLNNLITLCRSCHSREEILVNKQYALGLKSRWKKNQTSVVVEPQ